VLSCPKKNTIEDRILKWKLANINGKLPYRKAINITMRRSRTVQQICAIHSCSSLKMEGIFSPKRYQPRVRTCDITPQTLL
jgi:hypothetical protein